MQKCKVHPRLERAPSLPGSSNNSFEAPALFSQANTHLPSIHAHGW